MKYFDKHPGRVESLRPTTIGALYVQQSVEYHAGYGFTIVPVRQCFDVRDSETNKLIAQADTRIAAVSLAHEHNAKCPRR